MCLFAYDFPLVTCHGFVRKPVTVSASQETNRPVKAAQRGGMGTSCRIHWPFKHHPRPIFMLDKPSPWF